MSKNDTTEEKTSARPDESTSTDGGQAVDWEAVSFCTSSTYRIKTLVHLSEKGPRTPTQIAEAYEDDMAHISRALNEMRDRDLVELLVPDERKKGRYYGIVDGVEPIINRAREIGEFTDD